MVNSLENEAVDISKLGIEIIVISVLLTTVVIFALYSRFLFSKEEYRKYQTRYMNETSENWTFESRAEKAEKAYYADGNSLTAVTDNMKVTGNDIVNFIIKNDTKYNYYIYPEAHGIQSESERTHKLLRDSTSTGISNRYSEDHLLKMIRSNNDNTNLATKFYVKVIRQNDETDTLIFRRSGKVLGEYGGETDIYNFHPN